MPPADRGSVWICDLGYLGKTRPCLVLSVQTDPVDRVLVTLVSHTTQIRGTRFEVDIRSRFLHGKGVFDAQQLITIPQAKLIRKLGDLSPDQLGMVETAVRKWLGF